ncbi:MAG TPA: hypothetical protein VK888_09935 [Anaerolineales bacterium]|nr:hypothetical protein [Anaerolineales bacterium]
MSIRQQVRAFGVLIIVFSLLMNGMNIVVYQGYHNALIQAVYGVGFSGLILVCTIVHLMQARKSGLFGLFAYLMSMLSLGYANVATFLVLAQLSGIEEIHQTLLAVWDPVIRTAVFGAYLGLILFGGSIAWTGVFPKGSGLLITLGAVLQLPAQYAMETAGPLFFLFTIGGSVLVAAGLIWVGWTLVSGRGLEWQIPGLSNLDRTWGGPFVIVSGVLLAVDAFANMIGGLSLTSGITHLASYTALLLLSFILYAVHGEKASWRGFFGLTLAQLGAACYIITAYLILAQLAGVIDNNRAMMASWFDIPVGRYGGYLTVVGMFLLGWEAIRSGVFPQGAGWLVVLGIALALPFLFTIQAYFLGMLWVLGAILEAAGVAWMGWMIIKSNPAVEQAPLAEGLP